MHDQRLAPAVQLDNTRKVLEARQNIDDASLAAQKLSQSLVDNNARIHGDIKRILQRKHDIDNAGSFTQTRKRQVNEKHTTTSNVT